jgi:PhnB protein
MNKNIVIQPWLSIDNAVAAVTFYKNAFDANETYRLETPNGLVVRLSVHGAEFWVSGGISENNNAEKKIVGGKTVLMILITDDPDALFVKALKAGATEVFPIGEEHGWRLGRIEDPFGLCWEIGHQLSDHF